MDNIVNLSINELLQVLNQGADKSVAQPLLEIIDQIHELILEDCRISAKSIAEQLGISRERVGSIIREDLYMLVACFVPGRANDLSVPTYLYLLHSMHLFFHPFLNFVMKFQNILSPMYITTHVFLSIS
jgi:hypothetical protein